MLANSYAATTRSSSGPLHEVDPRASQATSWSRHLRPLFAGLMVCATSAQADVILSNFPNSGDSFSTSALSTSNHKAVSFIVGAQAYELDAITLRISRDGPLGIGVSSTTPIVELRNDSGDPNTPGNSVVVNFVVPADDAGIDNEEFLPDAPFTLQSNTTYWLVVRSNDAPTASGLYWTASSAGIAPSGIVDFGIYRSSQDGGASWGFSGFRNTFEIEGTAVAVSAPSVLALMGMVLLAFASPMRRRPDESHPQG